MDSNALMQGLAAAPRRKAKRLRRCLNPDCPHVVAGGKWPLGSTRVGEYVRLVCGKCGAISAFNPIAKVRPHATKDIYVAWDGRRGVEHVFPKRRVLTL
jgi:hypothetical protein